MTDRLGAQFPLGSDRKRGTPEGVTSDELIRHALEASVSKKRQRVIQLLYGVGVAVLLFLGWLIYGKTNPQGPVNADVTLYAHTGVLSARGIAAEGHYVWIADVGALPEGATGVNHGEKVVRVDTTTGDATSITSRLFSLPFGVATSPGYVWVLNEGFSTQQFSILRINEATLAVTNVPLSNRLRYAFNYSQGGYVMAGGSLWISTTDGVVRVNTSTLAVSLITSRLLNGGPSGDGMVADSHYVWLSQSTPSVGVHDAHALSRYLVRISIRTGAVTKFGFGGFLQGTPVADNGGNLWIENPVGVQRFNFATGKATLITLPQYVGLLGSPSGIDVVAKGNVYLAANLNQSSTEGALVQIGIASGRIVVEYSSTLMSPGGVATTNGVIWVDDTAAGQFRLPALVRLS
jgi:streptogramin lyase